MSRNRRPEGSSRRAGSTEGRGQKAVGSRQKQRQKAKALEINPNSKLIQRPKTKDQRPKTKAKDRIPKTEDQSSKFQIKVQRTRLMTDPRNASLSEVDPLIAEAIDNEVARQANGLELIASENFVSEAVLEAAGSVFH